MCVLYVMSFFGVWQEKRPEAERNASVDTRVDYWLRGRGHGGRARKDDQYGVRVSECSYQRASSKGVSAGKTPLFSDSLCLASDNYL